MTTDSFTGRDRRRVTRKSVLLAERAARLMITIGGVGTIVAVSLIMFFLIWVVLPLWLPAELEATSSVPLPDGDPPFAAGVDEALDLCWAIRADGRVVAERADDGTDLTTLDQLVLEGQGPRDVHTAPGSPRIVAGYPDGRVVLGRLDFTETVFIEGSGAEGDLGPGVRAAPAALVGPEGDAVVAFDGGVVTRMSDRKLLLRQLDLRTLDPIDLFDGVPVELVASSGRVALPMGVAPDVDAVIAAVSAAGALRVERFVQRYDVFAGEVVRTRSGEVFEGAVPAGRGAPAHLFLTRLGDHVLLVWKDGHARHFLFRGGELGHEADLDLLEGRGGRVTDVAALLGETTAVVADDGGHLAAWFPARPATADEERALKLAIRAYQTELYAVRELLADAGVPDYELPHAGVEREGLAPAAEAALDEDGRARVDAILAGLPALWGAIESARAELIEAGRQRFLRGPGFRWEAAGYPTAIAASGRSRLALVGSSAGEVGLVQVNRSEVIGETAIGQGPIEALVVAPKENAAFVRNASAMHRVEIDAGHPEASFESMFRPVWYEGLAAPVHSWQSTGGTDAFEPKLGLIPLVFGTIKATFYSMLFGAPLALLAALYSSEFLKPRLRASLKSILELMASLPSVVLGFLAALIIAPYVQDVLSGVLAFFLTLPFTLVLGANLWQLMPRRRAILWGGWQRFAAIVIALPVSVWLAGLLGPLVERLFFSGNLDLWLDGQLGDGTGGWLLLLLPLSALVVTLVVGRVVTPRLRAASATWEHGKTTRVELLKFLAATSVTVVVAIVLANIASSAGFDPRGTVVDNYVQRNALVVGFVMGFAVIPIIYTLAEDALSSVPSHLRDASLGCGATPWQTAVRVIVPTAMSGLFSAVMIGLGRAVGETMIVLMAAGNTPVMDWNAFNGFRTLSANIAVELPEAARDTTHYRVLFLAALTLFVMTFALNTFAEMVRARFRKRAYQL